MFHIIQHTYFRKVVTVLTTGFLNILEYWEHVEKHKE